MCQHVNFLEIQVCRSALCRLDIKQRPMNSSEILGELFCQFSGKINAASVQQGEEYFWIEHCIGHNFAHIAK